MSNPGQRIGRVTELWRYPVKSMAAQALDSVDVSWHGLAGDRRWAFVRGGTEANGFPWLTLRQRADLAQYRPSFVDPENPDESAVIVHTPSGPSYEVTDPALAHELEKGARILRQNRGVFDMFPVSLTTTQSMHSLAKRVGIPLDAQRFRPNLLVEAETASEFPEDEWVGQVLQIGSVRLRIDKRDGRCAVITIDPGTVERNPDILRTVARERDGCLGVYGSTVRPGEIAVGHSVYLLSSR